VVKTILLLRHAKSAWGQPGLDDHDRPLNRRGERAAEIMAEHIVHNAPRPDLILCSTAVRTRQTLAPLVHRLAAPAPPISFEKRLYLASEPELLARLRAVADEVRAILLIGHNEGVGELAASLPGHGVSATLASVRSKFPTGALAVLRAPNGAWRELAPGAAELLSFVRPRDLQPD
jgi:phosphohistidine phosphatase